MRNLKKILSLVLAMAMMLSVMVTGAGAAFKDEADFSADYVTAAEVLTNLGVLKGYEDGSFQPKDTITRAETAALIYRVATADVADAQKNIYTAMTNGFDDVKNADWFAGYVNFCANAKFICGYGDGKFGPNDKVTGYQTLAMILRAVGYDHNGEFIGAGWELKTAAIAQEIGMLENVTAEQLGAPATRELVAELIFQAITCAPTVHWNDIFQTYRFDKTTLGMKSFKLAEVEGVVWANEEANLGTGDSLKAGETQIFTNKVSEPYALSTGLDIIGEQVTFWAVEDETAVSTPISKATTSTEWSNTTYKFLSDDDKDAFAKDVDKHTVYDNYDLDADKKVNMGLGVYVKVIDNPDAANYVMTETMSLTTVDWINNDGDVKLAGESKIDVEDAVYEGIAKDDVVLYITIDGKTFIEKAPYVTGYITKVNHYAKADDTATIGGEAYAESTIAPCNGADVHDFNLTKNHESTYDHNYNDKTYNYYQDGFGNIVAWAFASENDFGYALILDYDMVDGKQFQKDVMWVQYLTADGEVNEAVVDEDEGLKYLPMNKKAIGDVVNFRIDAEGEFVVVYPCDDVANTTMTVDADEELAFTKTLEQKGYWEETRDWPFWAWVDDDYSSAQYDADNLVAFYYDVINGKAVYGVKTGADALADLEGREVELAQWDKTDATTYDKIGELMMVNIDGIFAADKQYAYITSDDYDHEITADGNVYTFAAVNAEGEEIMLKTEMPHMGATFALPAEGDVVEYVQYKLNVVGKGAVEANWIVEVVEADDLKIAEGKLFAFSDNDISKFVVVEGDNSFTIDATAKFVNVSGTAGDIVLDRYDAHEGIVIFENGEALAVFVEKLTDGEPDLLP